MNTKSVDSTKTVKDAVLISLNIGIWQATRHDRTISEQVTSANEVTDASMGRFWKSLIPKCDVLDQLHAVRRRARTFHYENTLAWMHEGLAILPTANYESYMAEMRVLRAAFEEAVLALIDEYASIKDEARRSLGKLFNENDYPEAAALKHKYSFDIKVMPMPKSEGLMMLGLSDDEAEAQRDKLENDLRETYARANNRLREELYVRLETLVNKLKDPEAYVRDDTIKAVRNLSELLPRLNLTNDTQLDSMAAKLQETLKSANAAKVKNDPQERGRIAKDAGTVFNVMQAFLRPPAASSSAPVEMKRAA